MGQVDRLTRDFVAKYARYKSQNMLRQMRAELAEIVAAVREEDARVADNFNCDGRPLDLVDLAADIATAIRGTEL
jgi:hypothetical protein